MARNIVFICVKIPLDPTCVDTNGWPGRVVFYRIDVGLSHYYGGPTQVLQIEGDRVTVRKTDG